MVEEAGDQQGEDGEGGDGGELGGGWRLAGLV